ncbi:uncharacterized protein LOC135244531 isoform X3 [Anguilla rostrata]|uniref:uncharacterized protein LOC135244531 isoform X3 n=1 Tax=Anguilla rostrata TaxID=7938 RepID=UPI0030CDE8E6
MLSDRYNNKNYNVTWDGSIGLLDHGDLTVVGKAGQCKMTSTGVPRHQARHAVCDRKVESRPSLATKVPKSKKYVYDKSNQHNQTLANLKTEMESERILLEEKIGKLKQNMADGIQEKSRNRQKQLQEVQKENATLRGEIAALESQLKRQKAPEVCTNCQSLEMAVEEKALQLIEREKTVEELQRFCRKFCKQLTQQDRLLALMSELHIPK